jgi:hypothetical protein
VVVVVERLREERSPVWLVRVSSVLGIGKMGKIRCIDG